MMVPQPSRAARAAIDRFLAFHSELVEVKRLAASVVTEEGAPPAPAPGPAGEGAAEAAIAEARPELKVVDVFLRLRVAICPTGVPPESPDGLPDMGYVMAALADEVLLHEVDWPGRSQWMGMLLETSLYGSRVSGEEVFTLAEGLADGSIPGRHDLAAAILLALSLGFRGRWRHADDKGLIDRLRGQLYEKIYRQPPPSRLAFQPAVPVALQPVLDQGRLQKVPRVGPWLAAMAASMLLTLAASHWLWSSSATPLMHLAEQVRVLGAQR